MKCYKKGELSADFTPFPSFSSSSLFFRNMSQQTPTQKTTALATMAAVTEWSSLDAAAPPVLGGIVGGVGPAVMGAAVGKTVGYVVGYAVGVADGMSVGGVDGKRVGDFVGECVGNSVSASNN